MLRHIGLVGMVLLGWSVVGCGDTPPPVAEAPPAVVPRREKPNYAPVGRDYATPAETVEAFLAALRSADSPQVSHLLSSKARDEAARRGFAIRSPGSARARYTVGNVVLVNDAESGEGAHVHCTWSDYDDAGQEYAFEVAWIVRREEGQWRIAGMSARLPGELEPIVMNFEDQDALQRARATAEAKLNQPTQLNARAVPESGAIDSIPR